MALSNRRPSDPVRRGTFTPIRFPVSVRRTLVGPTTAVDSSGSPSALETILISKTGDPTVGYPQGYGPLNMIYSTTSAGLYSSVTESSSDAPTTFTGYRGIRITTGDKPLMATHLGRFHVSGDNKYHELIIVKVSLGIRDGTSKPSEVIARTVLDTSTTVVNGYNFVALEQPVVLEPNAQYYAASYENYASGREPYLNLTSAYTNNCSAAIWGNGATVDTGNAYLLDNASGNWSSGVWSASSGHFVPNVNLKVQ